jgi:hypothetical protein
MDRRLRALESGRRLENASISPTGIFQVGATATGQPVMYLGPQGVEIRRADGTLAFRVGKTDATDPGQAVELRDKAGQVAVSDSYLSDDGLDRPSVAFAMRTVGTTQDVAVTSASFVDVFEVHARKVNAFLEGRFQAACSDGTTTGEARLVDALGAPLAIHDTAQVPVTIPAPTTVMTRFTTGACVYPGVVHVTVMTVRLQVRRTAGAGTISVRPGVMCGA